MIDSKTRNTDYKHIQGLSSWLEALSIQESHTILAHWIFKTTFVLRPAESPFIALCLAQGLCSMNIYGIDQMWCVEQVLNLTLQLAKSSCPSYSTPLSFSFFLGKVKIIPSTLYHLSEN